ncbi:MAG: hypothetical protein J1E96_06065 [Ruminococcus sp.]|nr:hypothetical protein [Ruminococcus sp.]
MTSATYSKSSFKQGLAIFWWTVRSNMPIIIVYLAVLAFSSLMDIVSTMGISALIGVYDSESASEMLSLPIAAATGSASFLGMLFSIVAAIQCFGYLHGKRETDMFGSLPVSRRTLFFSRLVAAIAIGAVPMLAFMIPLNICGVFIGGMFYLVEIINALVCITANVAFIGLLSICCGKTSDKIISYFTLNTAFPVAVIMIQIMPASFLVGYDLSFNKHFILALTPLLSNMSNMPIYWAVFSVVCIVLCFLLIKRRKSESAQSHFAFKLPHMLIKLLASFSVGVVAAYIFLLSGVDDKYKPDLGIEYVKFWAGMLIGSFVAYLIIQIILAHGFKGFGKSLIIYGAMIACFGIYFAVLATGALGYSSYVPSAGSVKSVSFTDRFNQKLLAQDSVDDKEVIEGAIEAHKQIIEAAEKEKSMINLSGERLSEVIVGDMLEFFDGDDNSFTVKYTLKSGRKIKRSYTVDKPKKIDFLNSLEYFENYYPIFVYDTKYLTGGSMYGYIDVLDKDEDYDEDDDWEDIEFDREESLELLDTLRQDIRKYGIIKSNSDDDTISVQFSYNIEDSEYIGGYQSFEVPPEYKATVQLIQSISHKD